MWGGSHFFSLMAMGTEEQMLLQWKLCGFTAPGATTATRGCCDMYLEWVPWTPGPILPNKYGFHFVPFSAKFMASTVNPWSSQQLWEPMSPDMVHSCQSLRFNLSDFRKIHSNGAAILSWRLVQTIQSSLPVCNIKINTALIFPNIKQKFYSQLIESGGESIFHKEENTAEKNPIAYGTHVTVVYWTSPTSICWVTVHFHWLV